MRILFRVAAGPRLGFGHLRRAVSLAKALGTPAAVSIRGNGDAHAAARRLGCRVADGPARLVFERERPALMVIDDPNATEARVWLCAARARGIPVASVHDLGIAWIESDLLIDGSFRESTKDTKATKDTKVAKDTKIATCTKGTLGTPRTPGTKFLLGPRYMPLDPGLAAYRRASRTGASPRVLIALGGGPRRHAALALARAIRRLRPDAVVRIAGGFASQPGTDSWIQWLPPLPTLGPELSAATVAVVAGGVTLYEACHLAVPSVAVAVSTVSAQRHTVRTARSLGVTLAGGSLGDPETPHRVAARVLSLLNGPKLRARLAARGRRVVDGGGAWRVVGELQGLARKKQ